jgi:23S rRNA (cytosine1962-C5)-methyltransferase
MAQNTKIWRLKRGSDRRVRGGHPWAYSNELQGSPKGIEPGEKILLLDAAGKFLAHGYGNPASLIAFRAVSRVESETEWSSVEALRVRLQTAWNFRKKLGVDRDSFRWIFGEGDDFPGLVLDLFRTVDSRSIVVVQAHTAGVDRLLPNLFQAIEQVAQPDAVVIRNDLSHRKLEGIPIEEAKVLGKVNPDGEMIRIRSALSGAEPLVFKVDLVRGQKTGFFLDQAENIGQLLDLALRSDLSGKKRVRVLDLCSYVGQWSAQIAAAFAKRGVATEVLLVDSSARALAFAKENAERAGARAEVFEADVLEDLPKLADVEFDIVVCDPPALIPGRKDIPVGTHAYLKLNTEAFRLLAPEGWVVTCSCSQLLDEENFVKQISKASSRNGKRVGWLARGTQALDHPLKLEFPEGRYLKMWIGREYGPA